MKPPPHIRSWLPRTGSFFLVSLLVGCPPARAQQTGDTPARPSPAVDDLAAGRRLLEDVRDNVFSFDDEAFYWFCRYLKEHPDPAAWDIAPAESAVPWRFLLERPSDYRGELLVISGVLQARIGFEVAGPGRQGLGRLYQCELSEIGTRALCAVIVLEDPADLPIRSRVRAKGFFLKVRSYRTTRGDDGAGPLLVARRLELVQPPTSGLGRATSASRRGTTWMIVGTAMLVVVWLLLRRSTRRPPHGTTRPGPPRAPAPPSDADFDWLLDRSAEQRTDDD
jgi:hypothetical protein